MGTGELSGGGGVLPNLLWSSLLHVAETGDKQEQLWVATPVRHTHYWHLWRSYADLLKDSQTQEWKRLKLGTKPVETICPWAEDASKY